MIDPKIIEVKAKFARNLFDVLLKEVLTEEQVLVLVSGSLSSKL